jgi:phosphogluconate dehydratase
VELTGNLGRGVMKVSAVAPERHIIEAPAAIFHDQASVKEAFRAGQLNRDVIVVVRFQGPKANGMPELHALTPILAVLQDRGHKVALVTDGRMSGASGKVPSAIHVAPEALDGGLIGKLRDGDLIRVDATTGTLTVLTEGVADRPAATPDLSDNGWGVGRELFDIFRDRAGPATTGAASVI